MNIAGVGQVASPQAFTWCCVPSDRNTNQNAMADCKRAAAQSEALLAQTQFPVICKRIVACGSPSSHQMAIACSREAMIKENGFDGTWLVQQYINHDGMIYKVYVLGSYVYIQPRPSLPNISLSGANSSKMSHVSFNSQDMPKYFAGGKTPVKPLGDHRNSPLLKASQSQHADTMADISTSMNASTPQTASSASNQTQTQTQAQAQTYTTTQRAAAVEQKQCQGTTKIPKADLLRELYRGLADMDEPTQQEFFQHSADECLSRISVPAMNAIAAKLQEHLKLRLFGFDVILSSDTHQYFIVDINCFPSYQSMSDLPERLEQFLVDEHIKHQKQIQPAAGVPLWKMQDIEPWLPASIRACGTTSHKRVTIVGYGSLLSEWSARASMPTLENFRIAAIDGYKRCFHLVSMSAIRKKRANWITKEVAAVAAQEIQYENPDAQSADQEPMIVSVFDIPYSELPAYCTREQRYNFVSVPIRELVSASGHDSVSSNEAWSSRKLVFAKVDPNQQHALMCASYDDDSYRVRCGTNEVYNKYVGHIYQGKLWRDDIRPERKYLSFCANAAFELHPEVGHNFLRTSFLADGSQSIAEYMTGEPMKKHFEDVLQRHGVAGIEQ
jgi:Inositol 1,3,4-trisphosphate 5/6-kinase ATP-grasp domain